MRFKFRVYDPNTDAMYSNIGIGQLHLYDFDGDNITEQEGLVIMQWTGLQDKNGVDIYEGDIVEYKTKSINYPDSFNASTCEVFRNVQGAYRLKGEKIYEMELYSNRKHVEVVGNIFENPALIAHMRGGSGE